MKDLSKTRFEEEWSKAFEGAELPPNNDVWARLDAHLANQETRKYKNRLVWFQRIAAGILLLLLGSGAWLWMSRQKTESQLAHETDQARATKSEMARAEGGNAARAAEGTSPAGQTAGDAAEKGTAGSPERVKQAPQPGTSPDILAKARPATTGPLADGQRVDDVATDPALAEEAGSGPPAPGAKPSKRSGPGSTRNPEAYLARGGRNGQSGLHDARQTSSPRNTTRIPAKPLVVEESLAEAVPATGAAANRLPVAGLNPRTLLAREPVIRRRSILPHLNDARWAKAVQEDEKVAQKADAKRDRWQVGVAFTPGAFQPNFRVNEGASSYNSINQIAARTAGTNPDPLSVANRELENATARGLSYQTGLRLEYALSRRFSVQSGVDYMYNNSGVNTYSFFQESRDKPKEPAYTYIVNFENKLQAESPAGDALSSGFGNFSPRDVSTRTLRQDSSATLVQNEYQYVSIPVRVNYQLLAAKLGVTLGAGVSGDMFLSNRFSNEEENVNAVHMTSTKGTAYRKLGFSAWLGLKMHYRFARKYSVFLEPSYRTAVTSFTNTPALRSHPSLFGVGTGLQMLF